MPVAFPRASHNPTICSFLPFQKHTHTRALCSGTQHRSGPGLLPSCAIFLATSRNRTNGRQDVPRRYGNRVVCETEQLASNARGMDFISGRTSTHTHICTFTTTDQNVRKGRTSIHNQSVGGKGCLVYEQQNKAIIQFRRRPECFALLDFQTLVPFLPLLSDLFYPISIWRGVQFGVFVSRSFLSLAFVFHSIWWPCSCSSRLVRDILSPVQHTL